MEEDEQNSPPRAAWKDGLRSAAYTFGWLTTICVASLVAIWFVIGRTLTAPDWLQDRVETRLEQDLGGAQVDFGALEFVLGQGWRPRVRLADLVVTGPEGRRVLELSDAEASLEMAALLRGEVQPKTVSLRGIFAKVNRDKNGRVQLLIGEAVSPLESAPGLPELLKGAEDLLTRPTFSALTHVELDAVTLRYEDARVARGWTLDGGHVALERDDDDVQLASTFSVLGGGAYASTIELNYSSQLGQSQASFGANVSDMPAVDIATQSVALSWLNVLRAPISGALRGSIKPDGALGPLSATLQIGAGVIQPTAQTTPVPVESARSYFTYDPATSSLVFDELSVKSAWGAGLAEGQARLQLDETAQLEAMTAQFALSKISLNPRNLYPGPQQIAKGSLDVRLRLAPFRLEIGQLALQDGESDAALHVGGDLSVGENGWGLTLDAAIDRLSPARLLELWPTELAKGPRGWVDRNLARGELRDLNFAWRSVAGRPPVIAAGFDFTGTEIQFLRSMPPIENASGHASFFDNRFSVTATSGQVVPDSGGALDVAGTSFVIPNTTIRKAAPGEVHLRGQGPVTAVLSLLNRPPLSVLKGTPLPVDMAGGQAVVTGNLNLPLKRRISFDEMTFAFQGDLLDVTSDRLVPGHQLTAERLEITGDHTGVEISGPGTISEVPATVTWRQAIGVGVKKDSQLTGSIELSPRAVSAFGIGLPAGSVRGKGEGQFTIDLAPGARPRLALRSDLRGLQLGVSALSWTKAARTSGKLEVDAVLGDQASVERLVLEGAGLTARGTVSLTPQGGLSRAQFSRVRVGNWLDAPVLLLGRGNSAPAVQVRGGSVDLREAVFGSGASGGQSSGSSGGSGPITLALDRLQISDTIALTEFQGTFSNRSGLDGTFRGKVNGQTEVAGRMEPENGRSAIRLSSQDAGGVFRAAGILSQGRGGDLSLTLRPVGQAGQFDGALNVKNTRVKDAPAMAALLNAASIIGLLDEMSGQGIQFTNVEALFRLGPQRLNLVRSSAVGPSIGLSMDGVYDMNSGQMDMRGVISPLYLLNVVGSALTRKGEGLIGFNYRLRGTSKTPRVQVNPLSALAPAFLRDVLRPQRPSLKALDPTVVEEKPRPRPLSTKDNR